MSYPKPNFKSNKPISRRAVVFPVNNDSLISQENDDLFNSQVENKLNEMELVYSKRLEKHKQEFERKLKQIQDERDFDLYEEAAVLKMQLETIPEETIPEETITKETIPEQTKKNK